MPKKETAPPERSGDPPSIIAWRQASLTTGDPVVDQIRERIRCSVLDRWDRVIDDKTAAHQTRACEIDLLGYKQAVIAGRSLMDMPNKVTERTKAHLQ